MAFTVTDLETLEHAIATGELEVEYDGKLIKYRSISDLRKAYEFVRGKLIAAGTIPPLTSPRTSYATFSKD